MCAMLCRYEHLMFFLRNRRHTISLFWADLTSFQPRTRLPAPAIFIDVLTVQGKSVSEEAAMSLLSSFV